MASTKTTKEEIIKDSKNDNKITRILTDIEVDYDIDAEKASIDIEITNLQQIIIQLQNRKTFLSNIPTRSK